MSRFLATLSLTAVCALAGFVPAPGWAQQAYQWSYERYDADSIFDSILNLTYGVPQTDDLQFIARCVVGANAPFVRVTLAAPIGDLPEGSSVQLHISEGPYAQVFTTDVVRQDEFIYGVEFAVSVGDPFIEALAARSTLIYAIEGQGAATLSLRGSAQAVRQFAAGCATIRGNQRASGLAGDAGK